MFRLKENVLDYVEMPITTRCTLKCKDCANLIQYYNKPYDVPLDIILKSIRRLTDAIDEIKRFRILGGEPLLHKNIKEICIELAKTKKIDEIIIVTNGTLLIRDEELLKIMRENDIKVNISDYKTTSTKMDQLKKQLTDEGIEYIIYEEIKSWLNYGNVEIHNLNKKELKQQFLKCNIECRSLLNGKLHYCPRSSHGMDLNFFKIDSGEYVNLLDDKETPKKLAKKIMKLNSRKKFIEACKYCYRGTCNFVEIPMAEQIVKRREY
jgi:MoaA/NifB/PqqE/SkfB family radical SAM enzyme